jgi:hypothetical protein
MRSVVVALALALAACSSGGPTATTTTSTTSTTVPSAAIASVTRWLGHLAAHDDAAAFADLAPRSQQAVGDVDNYRRGSGRFGAVYGRFAAPGGAVGAPLVLTADLVAVTLRFPGTPGPATAAVPVRRVGGTWLVDPILDAGSYSFRPDDGADVASEPTFTVQLDDPATRARVWFDRDPAVATSATTFRPRAALPPGWRVLTVVLVRGGDVVARTVRLHVTSR